jgi:hypothetical protein
VQQEGTVQLTSPAFEEQGTIPVVHTCDGEDLSPPLRIDGIPAGAETLVLIVDDPDAPRGTWVHWVVFNIAPADAIEEGAGGLGTSGSNSWNRLGYGGPCPPSGTHRYVHQVYALDIALDLAEGATKDQVLGALEGHVLGRASLTGLYGR